MDEFYLIKEETLKDISNEVKKLTNRDDNLSMSEILSGLDESNGIIEEIVNHMGIIDEIRYIEGTLSSIYNSNITNLRDYAFSMYSSLTEANFPACTNIGSSAFYSCTSLTEANFPVCTYIDDRAFMYCSSLTTANFPVCTSIGDYAFDFCRKLTTVNFPACSYIASDAFYYCTSLSSISFPACTDIGSRAFYYCTSLTTLILGASSTVSLPYSTTFDYTPMSDSSYTGSFGSIYVPASLVDSYKTANNWSYYADRITSIENNIDINGGE